MKRLLLLCAIAMSLRAETVLTPAQLHEDFLVMKQAYTTLHPGLYRYNDEASLQRNFDALEAQLQKSLTRRQAYIAFSRFVATIRCGHTYANFFNQPDDVVAEVLNGADKVPFTFRIIGKRMFVTGSADERIKAGTEITTINGVAVNAILDDLVRIVKGDGSNDGKRLNDLQVTGRGEYEAFDVYFPLLYPPVNGAYDVNGITVTALTRADRATRMSLAPLLPDDQWEFRHVNDRTAVLRIGTFVTRRLKLDWKVFLRDAFADLRTRGTPELILDIRGNEGGADAIADELLRHLATKDITPYPWRELLRYRTVPAELRPHLSTWDKSFYDRGDTVVDAGNGFYTWAKPEADAEIIKASPDAYRGRVTVLIDAANSSATFRLASSLQLNGLATLVGEATGGNRRGTNGGNLFFLTLPNSKIELDIPLIGYFPLGDADDAGLEPDVVMHRAW
ncbi:MAG TPA: S41 family peptidase [Thermoanaerobaculia bacterium]